MKSFKDFKDSDTTTVLTQKGNWKPAIVRCYGKQPLGRVYICRGRNRFSIRATPNHRWILHDGKETETTSLKPGDRLLPSKNIFLGFDYYTADPSEKLCWCYGFVFGRGTIVNKGGYRYSMVRLCGRTKRGFVGRFQELGFKTSESLSFDGDLFIWTGKYLKTAPDPDIDSPELIRAFVHGYLAADGTENTSSSKVGRPYLSIQSSEEDHQKFIEQCFPIAGVFVHRLDDSTGEKTNVAVRGQMRRFSVDNSLATSAKTRFRVEAIQPLCVDEAWCLEVEDDHGFVLESGIATGAELSSQSMASNPSQSSGALL